MNPLTQVVGLVASFAAIAAVGPVKAVALALGARLGRARGVSQRADELRTLRSMLSTVHRSQYVVVAGPTGVGKTSLVDAALQRTLGVVSVHVAAGARETEIVADACRAITRGFSLGLLDHSVSARRVLWWHHFLFRQPATVVLRGAARTRTQQQYADLDSSARALTEGFCVRVLIDAASHSLPDAGAPTQRDILLELEPMRRELLEELPGLQPLHAALKKAHLADVVWLCMGGNPADYQRLETRWMRQPSDLQLVVAQFVQNLVGRALDNVSSAVARDVRQQGLFDMFRESSAVLSASLAEMKIVRPSPDLVLRVVEQCTSPGARGNGSRLLVPADAATFVVLRHGLTDVPSLDELKALVVPGED